MRAKTGLAVLSALFAMLLVQDASAVGAGQKAKYSAAVVPFTVKGRIAADGSNRLALKLREALDSFNMFQLSSMENVQNALRENGIIPSNCASSACGKQAGEILGVRLIFHGSVRKVGKLYFYEIKLLHVASGETVNAASEHFEGTFAELEMEMEQVARVLTNKSRSVQKQTLRPAAKRPVSGTAGSVLTASRVAEPLPVPSERVVTDGDDVVINTTDGGGDNGEARARRRAPEQLRDNGKGGATWALVGLLVVGGVSAGLYFSQ